MLSAHMRTDPIDIDPEYDRRVLFTGTDKVMEVSVQFVALDITVQ